MSEPSGFSSALPIGSPGSSRDPAPPEIPDFRLVHRLGRGGFGEVWLGLSLAGEYRAIKVLPKNERTDIEIEGIRLYQSRARRHPNLIEIVHIGQTDTYYYYVLDLADSLVTVPVFSYDAYEPRTLRRELDRRSKLGVDAAVAITRAIGSALQHLHAQGLLHRDVKPDNIIFMNNEPKLSDVGLVTRTANVGGGGLTPQYSPREGVVDRTGDLYSLGRVLAEMLLGWLPADPPPFRAPRSASGDRRLRAALAVASKAAHPDPKKRYESAERMAADLEAIAEARVGAGWRVAWIAAAAAALIALAALAAIAPRGPLRGALDAMNERSRTRAAIASAPALPDSAPPFTSPHALRFRSSRNECARAPSNDVFNLASGFTIEFWFMMSATSPGGCIVARCLHRNQFALWAITENQGVFVVTLSGTDVRSPQYVRAGIMSSYAVTWEPGSGNVSFYRDGIHYATAKGPGAIMSWGFPISIGGLQDDDSTIDGVLDELRIWSRPATAEEIFARHDRQLTAAEVADPSLAGYWPFDEGDGQQCRDASGRGNALMLGRRPVADEFDPIRTSAPPYDFDHPDGKPSGANDRDNRDQQGR